MKSNNQLIFEINNLTRGLKYNIFFNNQERQEQIKMIIELLNTYSKQLELALKPQENKSCKKCEIPHLDEKLWED